MLVVEPLRRDVVIALDEETDAKADARAGIQVPVGGITGLRIPLEKVHIFDGKSGRALI